MKADRLTRLLRTVLVLATLLLAGWIFSNSLEVATVSATRSGAVTEAVNEVLAQSGSSAQVTEHFVRKSAHFSEYALLGALLVATVASFAGSLRRWPVAWLLGGLTACCDELLQRFIDGRSGQLSDVLLDSCGVAAGVLTGTLLVFFLLLLYKKIHKKDGPPS